MDLLYGQVLDLLKRLEAAGRMDAGQGILHALTDGCGPRELLDGLRNALAERPADLGPELLAARTSMLEELERCWAELHAPEA